MKNPLNKRILREIKGEFGKYVVIFLFMTALIGIVSGFLVADQSLTVSYNQSFEKYNVEDGNFELAQKADAYTIKSIEEENVTLYENFYVENSTDDFESTLRIYADRKEVDKVCLLDYQRCRQGAENRWYRCSVRLLRTLSEQHGFHV